MCGRAFRSRGDRKCRPKSTGSCRSGAIAANASAKEGDFLFSHFSIADATYASRDRFQFKIQLEREADAYCETIMALPAMQEWITAAGNEPMIIDAYEF
jgi:hypothetical protein